jgi:hypothetical protein
MTLRLLAQVVKVMDVMKISFFFLRYQPVLHYRSRKETLFEANHSIGVLLLPGQSITMSSGLSSQPTHNYHSVLESLLPPKHQHIFLSLPISPHKPLIPPHQIPSLQLHPVLEAALHILNLDLPAAHFLLRHMQADPAFEAMYLHGILHRIEGDIDNARAWYSDVKDQDVFEAAWPGEKGLDDAMRFLERVEQRKAHRGKKDEEEDEELRRESLRELEDVIQFCEGNFGMDRVEEASGVWVTMSEKNRDIAEKMITGGEGWRTF